MNHILTTIATLLTASVALAHGPQHRGHQPQGKPHPAMQHNRPGHHAKPQAQPQRPGKHHGKPQAQPQRPGKPRAKPQAQPQRPGKPHAKPQAQPQRPGNHHGKPQAQPQRPGKHHGKPQAQPQRPVKPNRPSLLPDHEDEWGNGTNTGSSGVSIHTPTNTETNTGSSTTVVRPVSPVIVPEGSTSGHNSQGPIFGTDKKY
ncbi:MAG: hypothetical protein IJB33_05245 [Akkermansia sp.]|nr:hypothetical protein [Akkermansia sp.]